MVVLAASICTRGGKTILSRQFRDLKKDRVTELLANFPKLTKSGNQHTIVEDDNVRYVYQPVEELYVVLITNRQSNILQDIGTLRLLGQIVTSTVRSSDEREILENAFDLLSAFDEVVTLGYRENLTLPQIRTFLEMESHEEKIQEIIERNKELEAAEERKKKAKQLEMQRREVSRRGGAGGIGSGGSPGGAGYGGGVGSIGSGFGSNNSVGTNNFGSNSSIYNNAEDYDNSNTSAKKPISSFKGKGLQLGSKKVANFQSESSPLISGQEDDPLEYKQKPSAVSNITGSAASRPAAASHASVSDNQGIEITIAEGISATLGRDGSVSSSEVKGHLNLRIADPNLAKVKLLTTTEGQDIGAQYKTNPNVDKAKFSQQKTIAVRDQSRPFPSNNQELSVLRWKINGKPDDSQLVPVTFNCWFSRSDPGFFDVTIEYELNPLFTETLDNLVVTIPLISSNAHVSDASLVWDQFDDHLEWIVPVIQPGTDQASGSFEFTAEADTEEEFFPMNVTFKVKDSLTTLGKVDVNDVVSAADESISVPFKKRIDISSDTYIIS